MPYRYIDCVFIISRILKKFSASFLKFRNSGNNLKAYHQLSLSLYVRLILNIMFDILMADLISIRIITNMRISFAWATEGATFFAYKLLCHADAEPKAIVVWSLWLGSNLMLIIDHTIAYIMVCFRSDQFFKYCNICLVNLNNQIKDKK